VAVPRSHTSSKAAETVPASSRTDLPPRSRPPASERALSKPSAEAKKTDKVSRGSSRPTKRDDSRHKESHRHRESDSRRDGKRSSTRAKDSVAKGPPARVVSVPAESAVSSLKPRRMTFKKVVQEDLDETFCLGSPPPVEVDDPVAQDSESDEGDSQDEDVIERTFQLRLRSSADYWGDEFTFSEGPSRPSDLDAHLLPSTKKSRPVAQLPLTPAVRVGLDQEDWHLLHTSKGVKKLSAKGELHGKKMFPRYQVVEDGACRVGCFIPEAA